MANRPSVLYYGDNLDVLRKYVRDETVDLVYLDPPFNSKADYNVLFKELSGEESVAQIQAFSDFWHWDTAARHAYEYLTSNEVSDPVSRVTEMLYHFLGKSDMSAYLFMMSERLLELHRVLKPSGSLFLHCDTTASHYLKLVLDSVFGNMNFRNEIIWKRFNFHADARRFGKVADRVLFYSKTDGYKFNRQRAPYKKEYVESKFVHDDKDGRGPYRLDNLNPPGGRGPVYEFHGITRPWRCVKEKMLELEKQKRIYTDSKVPQLKRYLRELEARGGAAVHEIWDDISLNSMAGERLGFQTQKPSPLLERIINAGSDKGDWVLDPFCGCGTAIVAAEKLERHWIGIDVTYLAINLVKVRLRDSFPNAKYIVEGEPRDLGAAKALAENRYQFQWWALSLISARPVGSTPSKPTEGKKGRDEGVDGWLRFAGVGEGQIERIVVQVKSGHVGVGDIRELRDVVVKQKAAIGLFVTLEEPTSEMTKEAKATDPYIAKKWNREYPKIQILTIDGLLKGKKPDMPPTVSPFQEAPRVEKTDGTAKQGSRLLIQRTLPK